MTQNNKLTYIELDGHVIGTKYRSAAMPYWCRHCLCSTVEKNGAVCPRCVRMIAQRARETESLEDLKRMALSYLLLIGFCAVLGFFVWYFAPWIDGRV